MVRNVIIITYTQFYGIRDEIAQMFILLTINSSRFNASIDIKANTVREFFNYGNTVFINSCSISIFVPVIKGCRL